MLPSARADSTCFLKKLALPLAGQQRGLQCISTVNVHGPVACKDKLWSLLSVHFLQVIIQKLELL